MASNGTNFYPYGVAVAVAFTDQFGNATLVRTTAANIPSGTSGYAVGCELVTTDTGVVYRNTGTTTSCSFMTGSTSRTTTSLGTTQNSTPTAVQLLGGIVTQTSAVGGGTVTVPTGTQLSAAVPNVAVGYTFTTLFSNLGGGQTLTITGQTGSTVIGTAAVGTGKNANLTFVNTGVNTWNVYCVVSA